MPATASWISELVRAGRLAEAAQLYFGSDERIELTTSIEDYNSAVESGQAGHGKLDTFDPMGSRMQWGTWEQSV